MSEPFSQCHAALAQIDPPLSRVEWLPLAGGRTNRLWQVGDLVVKHYDAKAASPLFPNDPVAEVRALQMFAPHELAPRLRGHGAGWIIYDHVPGTVWSGDPVPVARVLRALHGQRVTPGSFRPLASGSAAILAQARAIAAQCKGRLSDPPPDPGLAPRNPRPVHGDAVAGNVIIGPSGVRLIDWQCPALGDPCEDMAAFLSPAMQFLYAGDVLTADQRQAFLDAYDDADTVARFTALEPLFRWRMMAHCLWRAERGDADYARALIIEQTG